VTGADRPKPGETVEGRRRVLRWDVLGRAGEEWGNIVHIQTDGGMVMGGRSGASEDEDAHRAALRALITPGLYTAPLEDSALIDLPVVRARAGQDASPGTRAQFFIAALEEVVETILQGPDRQAAKILFGIDDWSGKPVRDRHHAVAKLRSRHWTWESNYRKEPLARDLKTVLLALYRLADRDEPSSGRDRADDRQSPLTRLSAELLRRIGRRRTAYPLDMSLQELHESRLYVEAELVRYHHRGKGRNPCSIDDLIDRLSAGASVLLLGEPGSGKSLTLYETALRCAERGLMPIPVRARDHRELLAGHSSDALGTASSSVLLVDGLDEAIEPLPGRPGAMQTLSELFTVRPSLFTSRLRDYEDRLFAALHDLEIDEVYLLGPWRVDREFKEYLRRLDAAELVREPRLYEAVVASEQLSDLVARPLYARMLTFIGEQSALSVSEPASLYGEYLGRLARAADAAIPSRRGALAIWQSVAWSIFTSGHQSGDAISMHELGKALAGDPCGDSSAWRLLDQVVDTRSVQGQELGEFLHYTPSTSILSPSTSVTSSPETSTRGFWRTRSATI
jgi:hypothetical protein